MVNRGGGDVDELSRTFSALADPTRRDMLTRLRGTSSTVGDLASAYRMSAPAVSHHLKVLETAGLIRRSVRSRWRTISLQASALDGAAEWVDRHRRDWNERLDNLEAFLEKKGRTSMVMKELTLNRTIKAPVEEVWAAWTDPDRLAQWHHPEGTTTPRDTVEVDLREGGRYAYTMVADDGGEEYPTGGVYLEIDPPRRLVYTWGLPSDENAPVITLTLGEGAEGTTELTFHLRGEVAADAADSVESGWEQALDSLERYFG